jgi:FADH2 O2-dependent halogenase
MRGCVVIEQSAQIIIVGSGFAGSLMALIIDRIGLPVILTDRAKHPRFTIGESSTPIADTILHELAHKYDLPNILSLSSYGTWKRSCPHLACGLKRGFSYFQHTKHEPFRPQPDHGNELLVAASASDDKGDTHWFRADVDRFLADEVKAAGIPLFDATTINHVEQTGNGNWLLLGARDGEPVRLHATFIIDATGGGAFLPNHLRIADDSRRLQTRSRAIYGHFTGVPRWRDRYVQSDGQIGDHPFDCEASALHHLLDGAWLWTLRFDNGITSVGLVLDEERFPLDTSIPIETEWTHWLQDYPDLGSFMGEASFAEVPGRLVRTGRLQRMSRTAAAPNWALLPHTAGFIDPLHSTGIAHSLSGIDRLAALFQRHSRNRQLQKSAELTAALEEYEKQLRSELTFIDDLVAGCYQSLGRFRLFAAYSMLYFAAATDFEYRQSAHAVKTPTEFLGADNRKLRSVVRSVAARLHSQINDKEFDTAQLQDFEHFVASAIEPFNRVGLCNRAASNMYRYTSAPKQ